MLSRHSVGTESVAIPPQRLPDPETSLARLHNSICHSFGFFSMGIERRRDRSRRTRRRRIASKRRTRSASTASRFCAATSGSMGGVVARCDGAAELISGTDGGIKAGVAMGGEP